MKCGLSSVINFFDIYFHLGPNTQWFILGVFPFANLHIKLMYICSDIHNTESPHKLLHWFKPTYRHKYTWNHSIRSTDFCIYLQIILCFGGKDFALLFTFGLLYILLSEIRWLLNMSAWCGFLWFFLIICCSDLWWDHLLIVMNPVVFSRFWYLLVAQSESSACSCETSGH